MLTLPLNLATHFPGFRTSEVALFNRMAVQPPFIRKMAYAQCIRTLRASGVWQLLDAFYLPAAHHEQAARINIVNPGTYDLTAVNSPTFTVDRGFTGNGTTSYLTMGLLANALVNFAQDSGHVSAYEIDNVAGTGTFILGVNDSTLRIASRTAANFINGRINSSTTITGGTTLTSSTNMAAVNRSVSTTGVGYLNGAQDISAAATSSALAAQDIWLLRSGATFSTGCIGQASVGASLTAAQHLSLYSAVNTYLRTVGAIGKYEAETEALTALFTTPPTETRKALINSTILALKTAGIWTLLDGLWLPAAADSQAACLNWVNPGTYTLTPTSSPTFTADRGFTGNGTTSYVATGMTRNALAKYARDSASLAAYCVSGSLGSSHLIGSGTGSVARINSGASSNLSSTRVNAGTSLVGVTVHTSPVGLVSSNRSGASASQLYWNGALDATDTVASSALTADTFALLRDGTTVFCPNQIGMASVGASLNSTQHAALYTAINTYLAGVGAV